MGRTRILVVDDDDTLIQLVESMFEGGDYEVAGAANGFEALDAVRTMKPDVILVDLNMPWMDGFAVCRLIRRLPEQARIVLVSADDLDGDKARRAGADQTLSKPFSRKDLCTVIDDLRRAG